MIFRIVNAAGVRGALFSTHAETGRPGDDLRMITIHDEQGELMPGYPFPIVNRVAPADVEAEAQDWADKNGWSRLAEG